MTVGLHVPLTGVAYKFDRATSAVVNETMHYRKPTSVLEEHFSALKFFCQIALVRDDSRMYAGFGQAVEHVSRPTHAPTVLCLGLLVIV